MMKEVSLFSFEVAVNTVYVRRAVTCRVPLVAFRLLDYPTIGVSLLSDDEIKKIRTFANQNPEAAAKSHQITQLQHSTGTYTFNQGKSCLLKTPLSDLQEHLLCTPLYIMLMDVLLETPKLVASCSVSLEGVVRRIVKDVALNGIDVPSTQGEREVFPLHNLMGNKVGEIDFGVRLISLGVAMLQHVSGVSEPGTQSEIDTEILKKPRLAGKASSLKLTPKLSAEKTDPPQKKNVTGENKENESLFVTGKSKSKVSSTITTQTKSLQVPRKDVHFPFKDQPEKTGSTENIFCPPALYLDKTADDAERKPQKEPRVPPPHAHEVESIIAGVEGIGKVVVPSSVTNRPLRRNEKSFVTSHATQTEQPARSSLPHSTLDEFPLLKALVEEVAKLGLGAEVERAPRRTPDETPKRLTKAERPSGPSSMPRSLTRKPGRSTQSAKDQSKRKQPLKFGLTHTMRLRMAMNKASKELEREPVHTIPPKRLPKSSRPPSLGQTFVKSYSGRKSARMVTRATGPDDSMYRQTYELGYSRDIQQQTVYLGRMAGYEEATDQDVPSLGHLTSESRHEQALKAADQKEEEGLDIEDLVIVKETGTPRVHSRQSQRSIEIHLPTASTEFTLGRDDDEGEWESTFSDREKLEERREQRKKTKKERQPSETFYTPPESVDSSRADSEANSHGRPTPTRTSGTILPKASESDLKMSSDISASDRYKYSDDFDDDRTWSANRTPSALTPINSSLAIKEEDEDGKRDIIPSKSIDSTLTTTKSSDFTDGSEGEIIKHLDELRSASAHKIASSDDGFDSSSVSRGTSSVVTALMSASKSRGKKSGTPGKMKVGGISVPEPVPSDSPVVQSINTESSGTEKFPDPQRKHGLVSKAPKHRKKEKKSNKDIQLPDSLDDRPTSSQSRMRKVDVHPRSSRMTPSPPSTRKFSPISSPESSRERIKRFYQHPGRRTRPSSSGSGTISSDPEKPRSPVRRSDSVSSYQPSDASEMSNVKLSEELDNLSDIISEEQDSQGSKSSLKSREGMPSDGPKTYFGKPKLDPSTKLGYTT